MPTNTFYNLSKEKQKKVIDAAKKEFLRADDGDVVIKNIVISAGIPRGSFYQYFESKEDLIDFIIEQHLNKTEEEFAKKIEEFDGDFLLAFENIFNNIISQNKVCCIDKERKIMEHIKKMQEKYGVSSVMKLPPNRMSKNVLSKHIDKSKFKFNTAEDLSSVFHIIISMMIKNLVDFQNGLSMDDARDAFKRDLDYLRYGILK